MIPPFIRPVPQLLPGTALTVSTGLPRGSMAFPAAGGAQIVDETGAILSVATTPASGALTATVTDAVNNGASVALSLVHALSSGSATTNIGVSQQFILPSDTGVNRQAMLLNVSLLDATNASEDAALGLSLIVAGTLTPSLSLTAPSAGTNVLTGAGATNANLALRSAGTGAASLQGSAGANIVAVDTTGGVSRLGLYGVTPVIRASAITAPATQSGAYVQADVQSIVTAVNAIRVALTNVGITL